MRSHDLNRLLDEPHPGSPPPPQQISPGNFRPTKPHRTGDTLQTEHQHRTTARAARITRKRVGKAPHQDDLAPQQTTPTSRHLALPWCSHNQQTPLATRGTAIGPSKRARMPVFTITIAAPQQGHSTGARLDPGTNLQRNTLQHQLQQGNQALAIGMQEPKVARPPKALGQKIRPN